MGEAGMRRGKTKPLAKMEAVKMENETAKRGQMRQ